MNHTLTPYRIAKHDSLENVYHIDAGPQGYERITVAILSGKQSKNNARHIVHCVNTHDTLVEALSLSMRTIDDAMRHGLTGGTYAALEEVREQMKNALAQAEKGV